MGGQIVWLCRHGERMDHVDPSVRGPDPRLSPTGIQQAKETGDRLGNEGITRIFASPFLRTIETAHYIAEMLDLPISIDWGLCEWLNKEWFAGMPELKPLESLRGEFSRIDPTHQSLLFPAFPEDGDQAGARAGKAAQMLTDKYPDDTLLLIGHGHSVMGMAMGLLGAPCSAPCDCSCLFKIIRDGANPLLEIAGSTTHLSLKATPRERRNLRSG